MGNNSKLYELSEKAKAIQQADLSTMAYFNSLNILYQKLICTRILCGKTWRIMPLTENRLKRKESLNSFLVYGLNLIKKGMDFY